MKKGLRTALTVLLALVFAGSVGMLIYQNTQYQEGEEAYAEAEALVDLPDLSELTPVQPPEPEDPAEDPVEEAPVYVDPYADALRNMDFTALREVNSDVLGWILIPNTVISYPLVQGNDDQYYLKHTWKKWSSVVGSIFLEARNRADLSDFNTIIYGHRMNNGSMFASLKNYKKQSYWSAHPYVYITDDYGSHRYEIFAAYEVSVSGNTYQLGFSGDADKQAFLDDCVGRSVISTGVIPTIYDRILTLSTCTGNGHATRWVVQARLKGEVPADVPAAPEEPSGDGETIPPETVTDGETAVTPEDPIGDQEEPQEETSAEPEIPQEQEEPAEQGTPEETETEPDSSTELSEGETEQPEI